MYLKEKYIWEISSVLKEKLELKNVMEIPKIEKIVLNMGIWSYIRAWNKDFSSLEKDLSLIAGQKPVIKYAKKSISNFKLREWMPVWLTVVLRGDKAYAFIEKMVNIVLPRVRDFRGLSKRSFDKEWNYNFGIKEHTIFPEVPHTDVVKPYGLQITVKTKSPSKEASKALLEEMGFPFAK